MVTIESDNIRATGETEREARKEFNRQRAALRKIEENRRKDAAQARLIARSRAFWVLERMLADQIPGPWAMVHDRYCCVTYDRSTYTIRVSDCHDAFDMGITPKRGETGNQFPVASTKWFIEGIVAVLECASGAPLVVWADHGKDGGTIPYACAVWGDSVAFVQLPGIVTMDKFRWAGEGRNV